MWLAKSTEPINANEIMLFEPVTELQNSFNHPHMTVKDTSILAQIYLLRIAPSLSAPQLFFLNVM
jgi:hypothetical protein